MNARNAGYLKRIGALFARHGEAVTLHNPSADHAVLGLFTVADGPLVAQYFDSSEALDLIRPVLAVYLDPTVYVPVVGDTFSRDGRLFTVRRVGLYKECGTALLLAALCD